MTLAPENQKTPAGSTAAGALLLLCVTAIAYLPALRNGFVWDDDMLVTKNSLITSASGLHKFWFTTESADYWPVTLTAFWVQWRLWGLNAMGYHAVNVALHITEALLLWAVLRRLRIRGAYLASLLFAVHPVNVETVAWISELKNLMAMLFFLATVWCFLKTEIASPSPVRRSPAERDEGGSRPGWYVVSLLVFTLGMLSKGSIAMLPVILLGIVAWHRRLRLKDAALILPFFFVSGVFVAIDMWFQKHGTAEVFRSVGLLERLLGAGAVVWFYLRNALWPLNLMFVYPEWHIRPADPLWWIPLLAAVGMTIALWRSRRPWSRPALFAWGFFCVSLTPVMGFTDVYFMRYSLVADRYEHLAIIGVVGLAAAGFRKVELGKWKVETRIGAAAVILVLACLTWRHCEDFRDARTLFLATLQRNPGSWLAYNYLGSTPPSVGQPEGISYLEKALASNPGYAEAHYNLGVALAGAGRLGDAIAQYEDAVRLKPEYPEAHNNLGDALRRTGRNGEAIGEFEKALRGDPDFALAHNNLGLALSEAGRLREAIAQYEETVRLEPDHAEAHNNLAGILMNLPGRLPEAISHYEAAARINPRSAVIQANLGFALAAAGRLPEAIAHDEEALRIDPGFAAVHTNLGEALMREGRVSEANAQFDEAARLRAKP